ncbi:unnamed protein product [Candida verbasci]|uniref:BRCT domain-containing protein n=1 Tax=Candida verbasci TaxID=1227364 RepID=A0A9W4TVU5_9ASCO|nr:unnamed protein product [Candida verbasci]
MTSKYKPLKGLVFCCTGFDNSTRLDLSTKIESLGGFTYLDLMTDVNYLIVGKRQSQKYQFCIKNRFDIKFISKHSIYNIYNKWLNGDDNLIIDDFLLPVFENIDACISRSPITQSQLKILNSVSYRKGKKLSVDYFDVKNLINLFIENGGIAKESLGNKSHCIICSSPNGNRYNKAVEWGIPAIHPIWVVDSLIRGAALNWDDYILNENSNEKYTQGCLVWDEVVENNNQVLKPKVKQEEVETAKKININNSEIWSSIMDKTKKKIKNVTTNEWKSDDEQEEEEEEEEEETTEFKKTELKTDFKLLIGFNFLLIGFNTKESDLLSKAIMNASGEVSNDALDDSITHIIVPAKKGSTFSQSLKSLPQELKAKITNGLVKIVTEFFIERCLFYKKNIYDKWGQPIQGLIESTTCFKVTSSGFTGIELLHIQKLIKFLNFEYCEKLTNEIDLIILNINLFKASFIKNSPKLFQYKKTKDIINCPTYQSHNNSSVSIISAKNKIDAAKKWNIPVVSLSYLFEIFELSTNKHHTVLPDICDLHWCIFAPKTYNKPKSLIEYINNLNERSKRSISEVTYYSNSSFTDENGSIKLPSPRKIQSKQKYGRIAGRSPQSIKNKLIQAAEEEESQKQLPEMAYEEELSQVSYQDHESMINKENLLRKLDDNSNIHGRTATTIVNSTETNKRRKM